jgi:hypothetical protein
MNPPPERQYGNPVLTLLRHPTSWCKMVRLQEKVKDNSYILQHVLGKTIFNRKIDFEAQAEIYTRE